MDEPKELLTLEVGARAGPILQELRQELFSGQTVVFIDKRADFFPQLQKELENTLPDKKKFFVQADAAGLPFELNSVGTIVARNMVGAHKYYAMEKDKSIVEWPQENVGDFEKIADDWYKKCAGEGKVIILETATPTNFDDLDKAFSQAGFVRKESDLYKQGEIAKLLDVEGVEYEAHRDSFESTFPKDSFAVIYHKAS